MARCCFKQGCELEVQYVCLCLSFETYCCEFHLQAHLKLPNRTHIFNSIFVEPPEGTKNIVLGFLAKEKSKKEKLKKIALASFGQSSNTHENNIEESIKELDSDLKEISCIIEKINKILEKEEGPLLNSLILEHHNDAEVAEEMILKDSDIYARTKLLCRLGQLKNKRAEILNRVNNDPETEQEFRKTCLLYENNASNPLISQAYQEYINSYQKITSGYLIEMGEDGVSFNLYIYSTEYEREEVKVLGRPEKLWSLSLLIQIPNGELFIICKNDFFSVAFIIDRNYKFRKLPFEVANDCYTAVYFNRNVYCFGGDHSDSNNLYWNWRFDLDENRRHALVSIQGASNECFNCIIFNGNILMSVRENFNIFLYLIDIDSFSKIPFSFTNSGKWLVNAEERLYLIECKGWIYESEVGDEYVWKKIAKSTIEYDSPTQVYCSYNKGGIYISILQCNEVREYFKFDLNQKTLIDITLYYENLTLKRSEDKLEAIDCYDKTFKLDSELSATYIRKGYTLYSIADKLQQLDFCRAVSKRCPNDAYNWNSKGWALCQLERYTEALECFNESLKLNPQNIEEYDDKRYALLKLGRNLEAIDCCNEAIKLAPNCDYVYYNKGITLVNVGLSLDKKELLLEAIECYNEAIRLNSNCTDAYISKGMALHILERYLDAIASYSEAVKLTPNDNCIWLYKGVTLNKLDRNIEAIECYNEAIKLQPDDAEAYINKGTALIELGKNTEAIECYNEIIKLDPKNFGIYIKKGLALAGLGQNLETINCYNQAIKIKPDYAPAYVHKGIVLFESGRNLEAIECYNEAIRLEPENALYHLRKGLAYDSLGKYLEAMNCFDEAIKFKPDYDVAYINKGITLNNLGRYLEAIEYYNEAIKLKSKMVDAYVSKGEALFYLERYIEAIECYNEAIKLKPDEYKFYYLRANIFRALGMKAEVFQDHKKAKELMQKFEIRKNA